MFIRTHSLNNVKCNFYTNEGRQIKHLKRNLEYLHSSVNMQDFTTWNFPGKQTPYQF